MKTIILLIIFIIYVNAESSQENQNSTGFTNQSGKKSTKIKIIQSNFSKEDNLKYQKAVNFFKSKSYEKSYELFNELFINYLDNDKINFYLC